MRILKVAFVTTGDPDDIHAWSGLIHAMRNCLLSAGFDVRTLSSLTPEKPFFLKLKRKFYKRFCRCTYYDDRHPFILHSYARKIKRYISENDADIIFSPSSIPIAALNIDKPIMFWTDANFSAMLDFYPSFSILCQETIRNGNRQEQLALDNCSLAIYASEWASSTAQVFYHADPSKIRVIPFGANLTGQRTAADIECLVREKEHFSPLKLLFIGMDWKRKGGQKALQVAQILNRIGRKTELHIVGCTPAEKMPPFVRVHGFISKKSIEGRKYIDQLFASSHFFILPSEAEAFGIVFAEASSFGLPSLATNVGGISSAINENANGKLFPSASPAEEYVNYILNVVQSKDRYLDLAHSSFREYQIRLNWDSSAAVLRESILDLLR